MRAFTFLFLFSFACTPNPATPSTLAGAYASDSTEVAPGRENRSRLVIGLRPVFLKLFSSVHVGPLPKHGMCTGGILYLLQSAVHTVVYVCYLSRGSHIEGFRDKDLNAFGNCM